MANETLRFYAAGPYDHLNWAAFDDFLKVGLSDDEYSIDRFDIISKQPRTTNFSLTGHAENHITQPSHFEIVISLKIFDFNNFILLKDWYEASRSGELLNLDGNYPTNLNAGGMAIIRWVNDDQPQLGTTGPVFENGNIISVDYNDLVDASAPWVLLDANHEKSPRRHYFVINNQEILLNRVEWTILPQVTLDFSDASLVYPLMQTEACVVTNAVFREEFDDDLQYWRLEAMLRSTYSTFRYAEAG